MRSYVSAQADRVFPSPSNPINMSSLVTPEAFPTLDFQCSAIKNESMAVSQNWQNPIAAQILKTIDPGGLIGWVPFFNISAGRPDLHVAKVHDCTHFCPGPLLWAPVWDSITRFYMGEKLR